MEKKEEETLWKIISIVFFVAMFEFGIVFLFRELCSVCIVLREFSS